MATVLRPDKESMKERGESETRLLVGRGTGRVEKGGTEGRGSGKGRGGVRSSVLGN